MGDMTTEKGMRNMAQQMVLVLPKSADLVAGYQWSSTNEMPNTTLGKVIVKMTYTYKEPREIEGAQFEVFDQKFEMIIDGAEQQSGVSASVKNQKSSGEILFNRSAGRLESSLLNQEFTMQIAVGGDTVNQKVVQKVEFKFQDRQE